MTPLLVLRTFLHGLEIARANNEGRGEDSERKAACLHCAPGETDTQRCTCQDFDDGHTSRDLNLHRHTARYRAATAAGCLCMTLIAFGSSHHPAAKSGMHTGLATVATASEQVVRALRTLPKLTVEQHDELAGDKTLRDAWQEASEQVPLSNSSIPWGVTTARAPSPARAL